MTRMRIHPAAAFLVIAGALACLPVRPADLEIPSRPLPPLPPGVGTPSPAAREAIRLRELELKEQASRQPHPDRLSFATPRNFVKLRSVWFARFSQT